MLPEPIKANEPYEFLFDISRFQHKIPYISEPDEIRNEDYHNHPEYLMFISSTSLKNYKTSPKWFLYTLSNNESKGISQEAQVKGNAYHDALASIANCGNYSLFENAYFMFDAPINERTGNPYGYETKAYKEAVEEAGLANPGKNLLMKEELDNTKAMINALLYGSKHNSADIRMLLKNGVGEQSFFCEYMGSYFKFRTDLMTKKKIVDWKSIGADDLHSDTITKQIVKFGYDISAAFYQFFYHHITGEWKEFYWVFQQKTPPYDFVIVDSQPWTYAFETELVKGKRERVVTNMNPGAMKFSAMLEEHLECMGNKTWHGASVFIEPNFRGKRIMKNKTPFWDKELIYYDYE